MQKKTDGVGVEGREVEMELREEGEVGEGRKDGGGEIWRRGRGEEMEQPSGGIVQSS